MKTKRTVISIFTLCTALLFTACSGKGTSNTEASRDTQTEAGSEASGSSNTTLDVLFIGTVSINYRLNLFHQGIIVVLIINSTEHRITHNITISID